MTLRRNVDNLSAAGAIRLAEIIRQFWEARGVTIDVKIEVDSDDEGSNERPLYSVRSDLCVAPKTPEKPKPTQMSGTPIRFRR